MLYWGVPSLIPKVNNASDYKSTLQGLRHQVLRPAPHPKSSDKTPVPRGRHSGGPNSWVISTTSLHSAGKAAHPLCGSGSLHLTTCCHFEWIKRTVQPVSCTAVYGLLMHYLIHRQSLEGRTWGTLRYGNYSTAMCPTRNTGDDAENVNQGTNGQGVVVTEGLHQNFV